MLLLVDQKLSQPMDNNFFINHNIQVLAMILNAYQIQIHCIFTYFIPITLLRTLLCTMLSIFPNYLSIIIALLRTVYYYFFNLKDILTKC